MFPAGCCCFLQVAVASFGYSATLFAGNERSLLSNVWCRFLVHGCVCQPELTRVEKTTIIPFKCYFITPGEYIELDTIASFDREACKGHRTCKSPAGATQQTSVPFKFISRRLASVASARKKLFVHLGWTPLGVMSHAYEVELAVACHAGLKGLSRNKCQRALLYW